MTETRWYEARPVLRKHRQPEPLIFPTFPAANAERERLRAQGIPARVVVADSAETLRRQVRRGR